jgi:Rab proteins geranylgeranyltransferase component A
MMKIEPDSFDVLVVGTGLIQSIVAASVAVSGKTVLQVDPNDYYGESWATLPYDDIIAYSKARKRDVCTFGSIDQKRVLFDLSPKLAYGDGPLISLLLASGAHNYTEFALVKSTVWSRDQGTFVPVAASRAEIFRDQTLTLKQKNMLMKAVRDIVEDTADPEQNLVSWLETVCDGDLMDRLLHGVLLQHTSNPDMTISDASRLLKLYGRSSGKYSKNSSPFLLPIYGSGEMPQAFCRTAAVHGAVQCLRCGVAEAERVDTGEFDVKLTNGQKIHAKAVIASPDLAPCLASKVQNTHTMYCCYALVHGKVFPEERHCLASFPRASSLGRTIWALQRDNSSGCCPEGYSCLQVWCVADDCPSTPVEELKGILTDHMDCSSIFNDGDEKFTTSPPSEDKRTAKVEFACFVTLDNQEFGSSLHDNVAFCGDASHDVSYLNVKDDSKRCFQAVCRGQPFPFDESSGGIESHSVEQQDPLVESLMEGNG